MAERTKEQKLQDFKDDFTRVHDYWEETQFYTKRQTWDSLINRTFKTQVDDFLKPYAAGIDIQSYAPEKDRGIHVQVLTLDSPRFDCIALDQTQDAKDDVEEARIYHASAAAKKDKGGLISKGIAQSLVQYGVAFTRADWHMVEEPGEDELTKRVEKMRGDDEDDDTYASKRDEREVKARSDYFREKEGICSSLVNVSPLQMCCEPLSDPTVFYQRFEMTYRDAKRKLASLKGEKIAINQLGKLVLLGDERLNSEDAGYDDTIHNDKKISVILSDKKDPETGEWYCCEVICIDGEDIDQGEILNEYVNPRGMSRYSLIESGDAPPLETDPHLRFRPMLYSEYVIVADLNFYETLLAILAKMQLDGRMFYIDTSRLSPEGAAAIGVELGLTDTGAGAQTYIAKESKPGSGQLTALPGEIKVWPFPTIEALSALIDKKERELAQERPSRFGARYGDAKEPPTATQQLDNRQAEAMPYSSYLQPVCEFWQNDARGDANMILYWDKGIGDGENGSKKSLKQYPVVTTGDENFLKDPVDPATEVTVTADTFKRRYHIVVKIQNQTQAEKLQNDLAADDAYMKGVTTEEQWYKSRGFEDPLKQMKERARDKTRKQTEAELEPVRMQLRKRYISLITGLDLSVPAPPMREEMMQGNGKQPQGNLVQAGPQMTPAPTQQPGATTSTMGAI